MRLLDAAVHENGAAAAEVDRHVGHKTDFGKFLCAVAENFGKGLQKAAAAAGAGLVQKDIIYSAVVDFQALHVLTADVEDEVDIWLQILRCIKVRHRFDDAVVHAEGVANQVLAIAGDSTCEQLAVRIFLVEVRQIAAYSNDGITLVALVERIEQLALGTQHSNLNRRAAGVNADKGCFSRKRRALGHACASMTLLEGSIFCFIFK